MGKLLGIVYLAISAHLINKAGYSLKECATGAVTLIQRFGWYGIPAALNRNLHFHILFLDGVCVYRDNRSPRFQRVRAPDISELEELVQLISKREGLYYRSNLSHRDIEDLLAERGITVSRESIRLWWIKFGAINARRLKRKHQGYGDTFFIDEICVEINGKRHYLWRAVDQDGDVVDVYLQARRDGAAAKRFFKRLLRSHGDEPGKIVTGRLRSHSVAHPEVLPEVIHEKDRYANNRVEQSHEATRVRERGMRR